MTTHTQKTTFRQTAKQRMFEMKEKVFLDWYHQTRDITARAGFDTAWQHQQAKVEELQKRVDAVKQLIEEYRDPPTEDKTFQHALSIVADELEQALKGGLND